MERISIFILILTVISYTLFSENFDILSRDEIASTQTKTRQESYTVKDIIESSTDNDEQVEQIHFSLRNTILNVPESKLDELEAEFESNEYYYMELAGSDRAEVIPVLLAGMKRHPEQLYWIGALYMFPSSDLREARKLDSTQKSKHCLYTLAYLQEAIDIFQGTSQNDPNQEDSEYPTMLQNPMALAAMEIGELELSKQIAENMLLNNNDPNSWNFGNVIHQANTVLGQVALKENDVQRAKYYLIESGKTPGSPQLNSFGPSFSLARELLEKGEKEIVLEYLDLIAVFWANPETAKPSYKSDAQKKAEQISKWKQEIGNGKVPDDRKWQ